MPLRDPFILNLSLEDNALITDLYQLTMTACYVGEKVAQTPASFELFVRRLPQGFNYLIAMGMAQILDYLENFSFTQTQIQALQNTELFNHVPDEFWTLLTDTKFTGDVWGVSEGTAIFANEPILRIDAPLWQGQLIETFLLNTINYQTLIATKAARLRDAAGESTQLLEFGTRRAFSPQGAIWAARAAIAGGMDGTSNVIAALKLGQKPRGTMAHSLVMAMTALLGKEEAAFQAFQRYFPASPLLIDTYDTVETAQRLAQLQEMGKLEIRAIRIDSGDLLALSRTVRELLPHTQILASGDLDELEIERLKKAGAAIDGYGIGTKLVTGNAVNGVYKLVEIAGIPTLKQASQKMTYPGRKQIFRRLLKGQIHSDRLGLIEDTALENERPLIRLMMHSGKRLLLPESLDTLQQRTRSSVLGLPPYTRRLQGGHPLPVHISPSLEQLRQSLMEES